MISIFNNYPLIAALSSILISQLIKYPIGLSLGKSVQPSIIFSTGGMPSSHSAGVVSVMTALIIEYGWTSPHVAIAITFGSIVIFDSMGVRRQSGEHSIMINELFNDFKELRQSFVNLTQEGMKELPAIERKSREMLGHKPIEVFFGILSGIIISVAIYYLFYV
ncbi:divergent PAP2 family protein [Dolosigranulum pigrum]|jgi:hypothetical protein|uniref:Divergent PAP2 family protein n=1 Tax=Dolosigranulum pigrum ATCC 51524 TaxID=883103 RepID=H3NFT3_9LACT|nr:divergent PAP2 family protein [Dolosigranulum pigrum]EHR32150.1 hypothetical protein HMPREF9703_01414 [Dolosigranulum pigrum ATCC 51524]